MLLSMGASGSTSAREKTTTSTTSPSRSPPSRQFPIRPRPFRPRPSAGTQTHTALTPGDLREMLTKAGADHNLDVDLLASVVKAESDGNARAVSHAGAQGLMQLMPGTAAGLGVKDSFQPDENVRGGSTYLDALLTKYHDNLASGACRVQRRP